MKRALLIIILSFIFLPYIVKADDCTVGNDTWCNASTSNCLNNLQANYNTWNTRENHSGSTCVKVIAQHTCNNGTYQNKSYLSGYDPKENYLCSNGSVATQSNIELVGTGAVERDVVGESCSSTMYVPEVWKINCSTSSSSGTSNSNSSNSNSSNSNSSNSNSSNSNSDSSNGSVSSKDDVSTNSNGQITGTTEEVNTGVETYFIVLIVMVILSYGVLLISKNKNIFKSI